MFLMTALIVAACTPTAPTPAPIPSGPGAKSLDCGATLAITNQGAEGQLVLGGVTFTGVPADGTAPSPPAGDGGLPIEDRDSYQYFAKTPILLPESTDWVSIEVAGRDGTRAWAAWVPARIWTAGHQLDWRLDTWVASTLAVDQRQCHVPNRALLGGIVMDRPGCVDITVRSGADPDGERRTIAYGDAVCS